MGTAILLAKFLILMLSVTGYLLFAVQKYRIRPEFAPALFCAWTSNLMFMGGILNFLPETAGMVWAGGIVLLVLALRRQVCVQEGYGQLSGSGTVRLAGSRPKGQMGQPGSRTVRLAGKYEIRLDRRSILLYVGFLFLSVYFAWLLRGTHYTSYDNFSHWATVVKDMLLEGRMPNFQDAVIRFQSYPLGSSLFLYYICRIVGVTDACLLWAQLFMLISFLFCLTVFIKKRNWYMGLLAFLYSLWALTANNSIYELRVDTLLPLAGVAAFAIIFYYKDDLGRAAWCSCGLHLLLVNMKNSGIFFYAACFLVLVAYVRKGAKQRGMAHVQGGPQPGKVLAQGGPQLENVLAQSRQQPGEALACGGQRPETGRTDRKQVRLPAFLIASLGLPVWMLLLWKRHVALVFPDGMGAKHSMSVENFEHIFSQKTKADVLQIAQQMAGRFLSFENIEVWMLLFFTAVFIAFLTLLCKNRQDRGRAARMFAAVLGCFGLYTVSMFGMYIFSMPLGEALHLASYDRYVLSVLIFLYGVIVIFIMETARGFSKTAAAGISLVVLLAACLLWQGRESLPTLVQKPDFAKTKRCSLQNMIQRDGLHEVKSYFVYCNGTDDDRRYLFYLMRYELWTSDMAVVTKKDFLEKKGEIAGCDYFVVWDSDAYSDAYLREHGLGRYQGMERIGIANSK